MAINMEGIARGSIRRVARWAFREDNPKIADLIFGDDPPAPGESMESWIGDMPGGGELGLMQDDVGWIPANVGLPEYGRGDLSPISRILTVKRARVYYTRDAFGFRAVRLYTDYCVGRGFSIKARAYKKEQTDEDVVTLQAEADAFWKHPDNHNVFSSNAQRENSDRLNVNGELFFVLVPPENPDDVKDVTRVRVLQDSLQIVKIVFNPEDDSEPWYYLRQWTERKQQKKRLYPDWRLFVNPRMDDSENIVLPSVADIGDPEIENIEIADNQFIYHGKVNTITERGNSLLGCAMDWSKVNRQYLEDRATISRAHARFAWKRVVKGPASAVAAFGRRAASAVGISGRPVPSPAGSTLTTNTGVDWESMNAQDGGKNAYVESRNFRLMFFAAVGFAEHYFGDGSNGTRATSKSMERPTELQLQAFQTILKGIYEALFAFNLVAKNNEYDPSSIWVDGPKILEDDTSVIVSAILMVIAALPEFNVDEIIILLLNALNVDDPQDIIVKIREAQQEREDYSLQFAAVMSGFDPNAEPDYTDAASSQQFVAKLKQFMGMLGAWPGDPAHFPGPKQAPQFSPGGPGASLKTRLPSPPKTRIADPITTA